MSIKLDYKLARKVLLEASALAEQGRASSRWKEHIQRLSDACRSAPKTHIAFIGTALLARSTDQRIDVRSLHARAKSPGAYSARSLAKDVLVPASRELRVHLGVTGREPLNNQPYFHNDVVNRQMNVKGNARVALNLVCDLLDELSDIHDPSELNAALAAFVEVRRQYWTTARDYFASDLRVFASKAARFGVPRAAILAVARTQGPLDLTAAQAEAAAEGVNLELFIGWTAFVRQLFFWLRGDAADPVRHVHERIYSRLVELECSAEAQSVWLAWDRSAAATAIISKVVRPSE